MSIGEIICNKREEKGLSQLQLSEKVGVSRSMIAQIERDTKGVSLQLAARIAQVFGCKVSELVGEQ